MNNLEKVIEKIEEECAELLIDIKKSTNKSAARRARKLSLSLTKAFKLYRSLSIK